MKIVESLGCLHLYGDDMKAYDQIPAGTYEVYYSKESGFYLARRPNLAVSEKVYGVQGSKVNKVLNAFKMFERNLGVILSGDKGIGKSLTAKMIAQEAVKQGYPVILVSQYIPGIANFIESIDQEVMVLFDEFDKTFKATGDGNPQDTMLSLFDGTTVGKKLFVVTCNQLTGLNDYLVNRPGRFHYHFRFDYPTADDIRTYLHDKIDPEFYGEIDDVINFAARVNVNYDCLRAIAFELNLGSKFKDAIQDMNIINLDDVRYKVTFLHKDGSKDTRDMCMDLFGEDRCNSTYIYLPDGYDYRVEFNTADVKYDPADGSNTVDGDDLSYNNPYDKDDKDEVERYNKFEANPIVKVRIVRKASKNLHYAV